MDLMSKEMSRQTKEMERQTSQREDEVVQIMENLPLTHIKRALDPSRWQYGTQRELKSSVLAYMCTYLTYPSPYLLFVYICTPSNHCFYTPKLSLNHILHNAH